PSSVEDAYGVLLQLVQYCPIRTAHRSCAPEVGIGSKLVGGIVLVEQEDVVDAAAFELPGDDAAESEGPRHVRNRWCGRKNAPVPTGAPALQSQRDSRLIGSTLHHSGARRGAAAKIELHVLAGPQRIAAYPERGE